MGPLKKSERLVPPLPGPVLLIIFQQLNPQEQRNSRLVCRLWKQVITFYNLVPDVADFFIDCRSSLTKNLPKQFSLLKKFLRPEKTPSSTPSRLQSLEDSYLKNCASYFLRPQLCLRIRAIEEMTSFRHFISPPSLFPVLCQISTLELETINEKKFRKMNLQHFQVLVSHLHSLERLTLPLQLLSVCCSGGQQDESCCLFSNLKFLQIQIPTLSILEGGPGKEDGQEVIVSLITNVAILLSYPKFFPNLQHLSLNLEPFTQKDPSKGLKSPEMESIFSSITKIGNVLGTSLNGNLVALVLSGFHLSNFTLSLPVSVFENIGFLGLFAYLAMRGLQNLHLSVTASALQTSLPTILHMISTYGCKIDLQLEFFLQGRESQLTTQYLLSLPEMCQSLSSLTLRFLADYDESNHMFFLEDFIPSHTRLTAAEGQVEFKKLTTFKIQFERATHKVFLTFGWLRSIWPHLRHISIIVGKPESYSSEGKIAWGLLKDKWKGRRSTAVSNVFYLRGILKFFPQLLTLVFWADLQKANDHLLIPNLGRPCERLGLSQCVPELQKMSLRGLGDKVTNDCIRGFYGMKDLTSLELIGNHRITNFAKVKLLEETPSLKQIKFKL